MCWCSVENIQLSSQKQYFSKEKEFIRNPLKPFSGKKRQLESRTRLVQWPPNEHTTRPQDHKCREGTWCTSYYPFATSREHAQITKANWTSYRDPQSDMYWIIINIFSLRRPHVQPTGWNVHTHKLDYL